MALLHVRATYAQFRMLFSLKNYTTCSCWCFDGLCEQGKLRGRSLARAFATPIKKITIDLEDEDMQWAVIYNAFASNERAFAQSRQSIFYSH